MLRDKLKGDKPLIMGVVNVTPDSFSDGGAFASKEQAVSHALSLDEQGADILDVGGESTKPGANEVSRQEELDRVIPVIEDLSQKTNKVISVDTRHTVVMDEAINAGAKFVNDVNALQDNGAMDLLAKCGLPVCLMHMQNTPKNMQDNPCYTDVVEDVFTFLEERIHICQAAGIDKENISIDVGVGFGKTLNDNLALIKNIGRFHDLGVPLLLGTSRKSFIGKISAEGNAQERLGGSIASVLYGLQKKVQIFRVHDVKETKQAFDVYLRIDGHHSAGD